MSIMQNTALFSLLGTTYGGDGIQTFALPDLRGRAPLHFGQGPGLTNYVQGEASGTESVTLTTSEIPMHNHPILANSGTGNTTGSANSPTAARPRAALAKPILAGAASSVARAVRGAASCASAARIS